MLTANTMISTIMGEKRCLLLSNYTCLVILNLISWYFMLYPKGTSSEHVVLLTA